MFFLRNTVLLEFASLITNAFGKFEAVDWEVAKLFSWLEHEKQNKNKNNKKPAEVIIKFIMVWY